MAKHNIKVWQWKKITRSIVINRGTMIKTLKDGRREKGMCVPIMAEDEKRPKHGALGEPIKGPYEPIVEKGCSSGKAGHHYHISDNIAHWSPWILHPTMFGDGCADVRQSERGRSRRVKDLFCGFSRGRRKRRHHGGGITWSHAYAAENMRIVGIAMEIVTKRTSCRGQSHRRGAAAAPECILHLARSRSFSGAKGRRTRRRSESPMVSTADLFLGHEAYTQGRCSPLKNYEVDWN